MRHRPQLVTTISPDMYDLLLQEKARVPRPMSFVLDSVIQSWATAEAKMEQLEARTGQLQQHVSRLERDMQAVGKYLDQAGA